MRKSSVSLCSIAALVALVACGGGGGGSGGARGGSGGAGGAGSAGGAGGAGGGDTTTIQTKEGSLTVGSVDQSKVGAPIYPGASAEGSSAVSASSEKGAGSLTAFTTTDSFDKVYEFYKSRMPAGSEKSKVVSTDESAATFEVGDAGAKEHTEVMISAKPGETTIAITHAVKSDSEMQGQAASPEPSP